MSPVAHCCSGTSGRSSFSIFLIQSLRICIDLSLSTIVVIDVTCLHSCRIQRRSISRRGARALSLSFSLFRGSVTRDRIHGICTGYSLKFCDRNLMEITAVLFPSIEVLRFSRLSFLLPLPVPTRVPLSFFLSLFYFLHRENRLTIARVVGFSSLGEFHEIMSLLVISAAKYFSRF